MEEIDFLSIIAVAFFGSFGHCIGMCGGFIVAYSSVKFDETSSRAYQLLSHISYNIGRISSYILIGAIFGYIGSVVSVGVTARGLLLVFLGFFMLLVSLSLLGKSKFLNNVEIPLANSRLFKNSFTYLMRSSSFFSFYFLGILNGFIPCGFVYFFAATAAETASPAWGALVMLLFGLSTIPVMSMLGAVVGFLNSSKIKSFMLKLSAATIALYGSYTLYKAYLFLFAGGIGACH